MSNKATAGASKRSTTSPNNQKKQKRAVKRSKQLQLARVSPHAYLSPCANDFLRVMTDPFAFQRTGRDVCVPDLLDMPSLKLNTLHRGIITIGTAGIGFVTVAPFNFLNDSLAISYSSSTYAGTTFAVTGTGVVLSYNTRLPYATADARSARLVGMGLKVRYSGTELTRSGGVVPLTALADGDSLVGLNFSDASTRPASIVYPCDRNWHGCAFKHVTANAYGYTNTSFPVTTSGNAKMGAIFYGTAGQTYEYEWVSYFEFTSLGNDTIFGQTASHSDVTGMSMIRDFLGHASNSEIGQSFYNSAIDYLKKSAMGAVSSAFGLPPAAGQLLLTN